MNAGAGGRKKPHREEFHGFTPGDKMESPACKYAKRSMTRSGGKPSSNPSGMSETVDSFYS
jgi:hypothetical protein